jgi:hypothetical protein
MLLGRGTVFKFQKKLELSGIGHVRIVPMNQAYFQEKGGWISTYVLLDGTNK